MKKYTKLIILSVVLLVLIALVTLAMVFDVDLFLFKNLSIAGVQEKKLTVEELISKQLIEESSNVSAKTALQTSKNNFDVAKETYENIDESTISIVQEATKEEKYFIEYLWIVLGNYAAANNVGIDIHTAGATVAPEESTDNTENETTTNTSGGDSNITVPETSDNGLFGTQAPTINSITNSGVKITIEGRYANVADFVFDVENDKSLKFKLDNIKMTYSGDNKIQATFDVLSLSVLK